MNHSTTLRIAAAQMKFAPTIGGNLEKIEHAAAEAKRRRADALLFPECAVTGYNTDFTRPKPADLRAALRDVKAQAKKSSAAFLESLLE